MRLPAVFAALLAMAVTACSARVRMTKHEVRERQLEAAKRWQTNGQTARTASGNVKRNGAQHIMFAHPKASG